MHISKNNQVLLLAFSRGYRVDLFGQVIGMNGGVMKPSNRRGYLRFNITTPIGVRCVFIHKLQAYQKFGDAMFVEGIQVRHKDCNSLNNCWENILLGTHQENMLDLPPERRRARSAKANRQYSDEKIAAIRTDHESGMSYNAISAKHTIPKSMVSYYVSRKAIKQAMIAVT